MRSYFNIKKSILTSIVIVLFMGTFLIACGKAVPTQPKEKVGPATSETKKVPTTVAEIAMYEGEDREQLLLEGAKKEGTLNFYTSLAETDLAKVVKDFEKKYGIKVNAWRSGTDQVLQKIITESQAGKHSVDVVHVSGEEMEALVREKQLQEAKSPHLKDLLPKVIQPHNEYAVTMLTLYVQAYNTNLVKKEDLPKSYQDLLDPKWKGKMAIEAKDLDWFISVAKSMGEEKGIQFFKDLVKTNGIKVFKGHSLINNFVISGEVPLGLTLYHYMPAQAKKKGAPIDWFTIGGTYARLNGVGITKNSSHPHAAMLFYDYLISDGQKIFADSDYYPSNTKVETAFKDLPFTLINPADVLDDGPKWDPLFEDILVKRK